MMSDTKKLVLWLVGAAGLGVIAVATAFAMKLVLQEKPEVTAPAAVQQAAQPAPVADTAEVVAVKPHYVTESYPERQCRRVQHTVYVAQQSGVPGAGAVIGGVAGGLLGSQVGGGTGRIVASAAGAVVGAMTGSSMQDNMNQPQPYAAYSTHCTTHTVNNVVQKGYEVSYRYHNSEGMVILNNPPIIGSALPLS